MIYEKYQPVDEWDNRNDLLRRAAELLTTEDGNMDLWHEKRDQWLRDAGMEGK
jgi:hypothetical protein